MKVNLRKSQDGIAVQMIVLALVVLGVVAGGGYYIYSRNEDKKAGEGTSVVNKELQTECQKYYDDKDFCKFVSSWTFGGEQKMTMTSAEDDSVSVVETDASGNTRMTATQGGTEAYAAITMGTTTFIKNTAAGNWTKFTSSTPDSDTPVDTTKIESELDFDEEIKKDTSKIEKLDKEACGNQQCFKYRLTDSDAPGEENIIWFDDKDYKLRKWEASTSDGKSVMEFEYSVSPITEPSPVVDMPSAEDMQNMSAEELQRMMEQFGQ